MRDGQLSEYELGGTEHTTVFPKGKEAFTNHDRRVMRHLTGQDVDPAAPIDRAVFYGSTTPVDPPPEEFFLPRAAEMADPEGPVQSP